MKESSEKIKLNIEQSSNLLRLGLVADLEKKNHVTEKDRQDFLLDVLASKLPTDPSLIKMLPTVLQSLSEELQSVSGKSLGDFVQSPKTKIATIRRIKDFAKELGASTKNEVERDVALAVYFAAIANALVYHNVRISEYTYEKLERSFQTLIGYDWIPKNLNKLFKKAQQYCSKKT